MIEITYDRSERIYKWVDPESGQVLTAPAGPANKAELFRAAVGLLDPDLYASAAAWLEIEPQLERVVWKGVELVANNAVETFPGEGALVAKVANSDEYGRYSVTIDSGYMTCECVHFQDMHAP